MSSKTKMNGLLKGLRYIQQIFEEQGEKELEIGLPTDVKHVAHIGWDGPSQGPTSNAPSWISSFKGEGDSSGAALFPNFDAQEVPRVRDPRLPGKEKRVSTGESDSPLESPTTRRPDKRKGSKKHNIHLGSSPLDSPRRSSTSETRRLLSTELDSPPRDSSSSSSSKTRKKKTKGTSSKSSSKSKTTANYGSLCLDPESNVYSNEKQGK